jgi:predicted TIM-barrel fold metal-dependent hydrolase
MHFHAMLAAGLGPPPQRECAPVLYFPPVAPSEVSGARVTECARPLESPLDDDALMRRNLKILEEHNILAVASGHRETIRRWQAAAPRRIIRAASHFHTMDSVRYWAQEKSIGALAEMLFQGIGEAPGDSTARPWFALAEEFDLPVGVHMGLGPTGVTYTWMPQYRMRLGNPLLLEDVLVRHPKLRLYVMHAGWPMIDQMIGLMYAHPQVYVDTGVISWFLPKKEFYRYLERLVDAGFGKRIMFGSDQMVWPEAIPIAIEAIKSAPFLTAAQKRDILYNNAARFLRLAENNSAK